MKERISEKARIASVTLFSFVMYVLCFEPIGIAEFAYIFAIPIYLLLRGGIVEERFFKKTTLIFSILSWIVIIAWMRHVYPPSGYLFWLALSTIVGFIIWLWYFYLPRFIAKNEDGVITRIWKAIVISSLWVSLEWLRGNLFTGFPWLLLGNSQWLRPASIQLVEFCGTWVVSFTLIFFNIGLGEYIYRQYIWHRSKFSDKIKRIGKVTPEFYIAVALILSSILYFNANLPTLRNVDKRFRVGMVQTDFEGLVKWDAALGRTNLDIIKRLSEGLKEARVDVILWPESSTPPIWPVIGYKPMQDWIEDLVKDLDTPLLMGNEVYKDGENPLMQGASFYVSPREGLNENYYAKEHLVPFGEYLPKWCFFIDSTVVPVGKLTAGSDQYPIEATIAGDKYKVGCLICYEDVFLDLGRKMVARGAELLFVCTNDSWYGREGGAWQHGVHSAFQAVSTRRPVLRSSNNGMSCVFNQYGQMMPTITLRDTENNTWDGSGNLSIPMDLVSESNVALNPYTMKILKPCPMLNNRGSIYFRGGGYAECITFKNFLGKETFYTRYGDWFAYLCILVVGNTILITSCRKKLLKKF